MELVVPRSLPCGNSWSIIGENKSDTQRDRETEHWFWLSLRPATPLHFPQFGYISQSFSLRPELVPVAFCNLEPKMFLETIQSLSGSYIPSAHVY